MWHLWGKVTFSGTPRELSAIYRVRLRDSCGRAAYCKSPPTALWDTHIQAGVKKQKNKTPRAPSVSGVTGRRETPVSFVNSTDRRGLSDFQLVPACEEFFILHRRRDLKHNNIHGTRIAPSLQAENREFIRNTSLHLTFRACIISDKVDEIFQQLAASNSVSLLSSSGKEAQPCCDTCHSGARAAFFKHSCRVLQHNNQVIFSNYPPPYSGTHTGKDKQGTRLVSQRMRD